MPIKKDLLAQIRQTGMIKGKTLASIKAGVIKTAESEKQGQKDFRLARRSILNPQTTAMPSAVKEGLKILGRAGALQSRFKNQPATLLQKAKFNILTAARQEELAKKEKMKKTAAYYRGERQREEETKKGGTARDFIEQINQEKKREDVAYQILQEARGENPGQTKNHSDESPNGDNTNLPPPLVKDLPI
ncbi:MAG: hypothetical protein HZC05_03825 [Candidatus Magasanikbacteria bacterium]|nr:hypothetical protein [Candidatus Magasanikbacteria bacterium]